MKREVRFSVPGRGQGEGRRFYHLLLVVCLFLGSGTIGISFAGAVAGASKGGGRKAAQVSPSWTAAARAAGDYLVRICDENGRFLYSVKPGVSPDPTAYNWVRHAGTIYALCCLYQESGGEQYAATARRAGRLLRQQLVKVQIADRSFRVIVSRRTESGGGKEDCIKTGACALALVAFYYLDVISTPVYAKEIRQLGDYLKFTLVPGRDVRSKYLLRSKRFSTWRSSYYSGETLFALALLYDLTPDPALRQQALALLIFKARKWWQDLTPENEKGRPYDQWGMIALNAWEPFIRDADLAGFKEGRTSWTRERLLALSVRYTDNEIKRMLVVPGPDAGSFRSCPGRSTPTAIRLEGILAIQAMMQRQPALVSQPFRTCFRHWTAAIVRARQFLLRCQYDPGNKVGAIDFSGAIHGMRNLALPGAGEVRIDYCQHVISALLEPVFIRRSDAQKDDRRD